MSATLCSRCLSRSVLATESLIQQNVIRSAPFTTASILAARSSAAGVPTPGTKRMTPKMRNRKARPAKGKPPAPGDRKSARKKVVLNNPNALEVPGLPDLAKDWTSGSLRANQGNVAVLSDATVQTLSSLDAFQHTQAWGLFRHPAILIREETIELAQRLEQCAKDRKVVRRVICGERGSGKSVLQLQALALANLKGWLVIHVPDAKELVNAHTAYQPQADSSGSTTYIQPNAFAKILQSIVNANRAVLSRLQLIHQHSLPVPVQENISLDRFAELGAQDPTIAWPVWQAFWREILSDGRADAQQPANADASNSPTNKGNAAHTRPPVLLTLDGIQHIMRLSAYLDTNSQPIHAHDLVLVDHFCRVFSGTIDMPNGGMVLASTTRSNHPRAPAFDHIIDRRLFVAPRVPGELRSRGPRQHWDRYLPFDQRVKAALQGVEVQQLRGISKPEARGIMEYYARSGLMREAITQSFVNDAWTVSGGGIIGQVEKASVKRGF